MQNDAAAAARQRRAPLFEALVRHVSGQPVSYHVPGHRGGDGFDPEGQAYYASILPLDLTELSGLDGLHHPQGVIEEAQALAAEAFGAERTHFLVGGSTAGNLAMIWAVCQRGDKLLVPRNAHQSVFHACLLAGVRVVTMVPRVDAVLAAAGCVYPDAVEEALMRHPDAKAVFITNPTYYGLGIDLHRMADVVHRHGIPLLVDEAHGAHFAFHRGLPATALSAGADAVVQSTHKTLPALTMGAMLHLQGDRIKRESVAQVLRMIQTSSPSYPIMASLDLARRLMVTAGEARLGELLSVLADFRQRLREAYDCWQVPEEHSTAYEWVDPLRLVLQPRRGTGFQWLHRMEEKGLYPEFADPVQVVCIFTAVSSPRDLFRLEQFCRDEEDHFDGTSYPESALKEVDPHHLAEAWQFLMAVEDGQLVDMEGLLHQAREWVPYGQAVGRKAADMLTPYPPGVPLLMIGERVTPRHLALLRNYLQQGLSVQGLQRERMAVFL